MANQDTSTRRRRRNLALVASVAMLASPVLAADDPTQTAPAHTLYSDPKVPDISGLWMGSYTLSPGFPPEQFKPNPQETGQWEPWPPPLTPEFQKRADIKIAAAKKGRALGDNGAKCRPFGMPIMFVAGVYPFEITETPGAVVVWVFNTFPIFIWTDGRGHPKNLQPSYNGDSIGHWVGDILYVDTVGILDSTPYENGERAPHSGKLHMMTTIRRAAPDVLHFQITLDDPDAFTEPMVTTNVWRRKSGPLWQMLDDASCFENNRNLPDATGAVGFQKF